MKPNNKADRDKKIAEALRAVIKSDPLADIAFDAIAQGVTEGEYTKIVNSIPMPDPVRLKIQNAYRDVACSIRYKVKDHRRNGEFSTYHWRE